jgi:hypothetical protein
MIQVKQTIGLAGPQALGRDGFRLRFTIGMKAWLGEPGKDKTGKRNRQSRGCTIPLASRSREGAVQPWRWVHGCESRGPGGARVSDVVTHCLIHIGKHEVRI